MPIVNECTCDSPPGGGGTCAPRQLSICRNDGVHCRHECRDSTPAAALSLELFERWAFDQITGTATYGPLSPSEQQMLYSGRYVDPVTGDIVTFQLPEVDGTPSVVDVYVNS